MARMFLIVSCVVAAASALALPAAHEQHAPAHYEFSYSVHDAASGDIKQQQESRHGDSVQGSYSLVEPDGRRRIVDYTADAEHGFNAVVRHEGEAHAPAHKLAYAAPIAKVAYAQPAHVYAAAPIAKVAYAAPVAKFAYPQPAVYAAPAAKVAYAQPAHVYAAAPVAKVAYAAPVAKLAYAAPVAKVGYAAPTTHFSYSSPIISYHH